MNVLTKNYDSHSIDGRQVGRGDLLIDTARHNPARDGPAPKARGPPGT
jgi:hypothetical protein